MTGNFNIFDYIFYRLHQLYKVKEKKGSPIYTASLYLSIIQILLLFFVFMTINVMFNGKFLLKHLPLDRTFVKVIGIGLMMALNVFNFFRYKRKVHELRKKFRIHPLNQVFKVWMLYFIGVGLIIIPFFLKKILGT